jgi:hypothetical protein
VLRSTRLIAARTAVTPTAAMQRETIGLSAVKAIGLAMALIRRLAGRLGLPPAGNE